MTCTVCGNEIAPGNKFCNKCGNKIDVGVVSQTIVVPAPIDSDTQTCPFCAETIKRAAIKCKHCGSDLQQRPQKKKKTETRNRSKEFRTALAQSDIGYAVSQLPFEDQHAYQLEFDRKRRNAGVAYTLCILLGLFGVHKFYIGEKGWGLFYILLTIGPLIASLVGLFGMATAAISSYLPLIVAPFALLIVGPIVTSFFCLCDLIRLPGQVERANDRIRQGILYTFPTSF